MKTYSGNIEVVNQSAATVFDFLSDFRHFEKFLPEQIKDWEAAADYCKFSVQGMGAIKLSYAQRDPHSKIVVQPVPDSGFPVPFLLICNIVQSSNNTDQATFQFVIEAQVNLMISMMVDGPLRQFVEIITIRLKAHLNEELK